MISGSRRRFLAWALVPLLGRAQSARRQGTWTATGGGRKLAGTWTASFESDPDAVVGTWTIMDDAGRKVAGGSWSARKAEGRWEGSWQARAGAGPIYSGSWTARLPAAVPPRLSDLFEFALANVVSGTWSLERGRSGGWSIRAYPER